MIELFLGVTAFGASLAGFCLLVFICIQHRKELKEKDAEIETLKQRLISSEGL